MEIFSPPIPCAFHNARFPCIRRRHRHTAQSWQELGLTDGHGRHRPDFYVAQNKAKRLFVREFVRNAWRSLQAERLKPDLASVERKAGARSYHKEAELRSEPSLRPAS